MIQRMSDEDFERYIPTAHTGMNLLWIEEARRARAAESALLARAEAAEAQREYATKQWESWVNDQLSGTSNFDDALDEIKKFRTSWSVK